MNTKTMQCRGTCTQEKPTSSSTLCGNPNHPNASGAQITAAAQQQQSTTHALPQTSANELASSRSASNKCRRSAPKAARSVCHTQPHDRARGRRKKEEEEEGRLNTHFFFVRKRGGKKISPYYTTWSRFRNTVVQWQTRRQIKNMYFLSFGCCA